MLEGYSAQTKVFLVVDIAGRQLIGEAFDLGLPEVIKLSNPFMLLERVENNGSVTLQLAPVHSFPCDTIHVRWASVVDTVPASMVQSYQSAVQRLRAAQAGLVLTSQMPTKKP